MKNQAARRLRKSHPAAALVPVLTRYAAWTASTSEVERTFSKTVELKGGQSEDLFVHREEDIIVLQADPLHGDDAAALIGAGMKKWLQHFGRPRRLLQQRVDAGVRSRKASSCNVQCLSNVHAKLRHVKHCTHARHVFFCNHGGSEGR